MKKALFIITFVPCVILVILLTTIECLCHWAIEKLELYEGWCLKYKQHGWERSRNGLWVMRDKGDQ